MKKETTTTEINTPIVKQTKLEQGKVVMWSNPTGQRVIWMVCDDTSKGVVIHSDDLVELGTLSDLDPNNVVPFVGGITITSSENK